MSTTRAVPQPEQKRNQAADRKAAGALHDQHAEAFNSSDAKAKVALYTEDAIRMYPGIPANWDRQAIQAMFEGYFKQNAAKIKHMPLDSQSGGDGTYERGKIREPITPRPGQPLKRSLKHLAILKRQADGAWKIHVDIDKDNLKEPQ